MKTQRFVAASALFGATLLSLPAATVTISADKPGAQVNPAMWGLFFEDINFGADGGLYAELVKNRSFEFPQSLMGWSVPGDRAGTTRAAVETDASASVGGRHFLRLEAAGSTAAIENEGFRGIGVVAGDTYDFSVSIRTSSPVALRVELVAPSGAVIGTARLAQLPKQWAKQTASLVGTLTEPRAHLRLTLEGQGSADLDHVSLFPRKTWKHRPGGLRADMVQALDDFGPGFLRFPGGCIVEGAKLDLRYEWKKTLGPVDDRPLLLNRWNVEFKHRPTPDYFQSFGLGFFEYFQLCEDIGAEPLPILNCGMACQFNSGELAPLDKLEPYIQDALDLIEFANGPVTSTWGAKRAALGHPAPFDMKLLGVGNEQWGPQYIERFARFAEVLKAKHPEIALVGASGPSPDDERFKFLWPKLRELRADIVDEHCYAKPEWFLDNAHRYDTYDRNGPKVFMGEYAAQSQATATPDNRNTWLCALSEAAYMTGMERNADVVRMASYAPLFSNVDAWQWTPDLIWVDNLRVLKTTNYHVQRLFARNRGDRVLPVKLGDLTPDEEKRLYASSTYDEGSGEVIVKLVNATGKKSTATVDLSGVRQIYPGTITVMQSNNPDAANTFDAPNSVVPQTLSFSPASQKFDVTLPADSFTVLRLGVSR
ncbi:alpha-L-arabinofuranosidase [Opitutaceae bacterium EW11]|nr:alpha-L-arabinofuranosidase [Opitutaceae bacterium EW11]